MKRRTSIALFSLLVVSLPMTAQVQRNVKKAKQLKTEYCKNKKDGVVRISCVGASITEGYGTKDWKTDSYPGAMGRLLGSGYTVENYGRGGCTMLIKGDCPYSNFALVKKKYRNLFRIVVSSLPLLFEGRTDPPEEETFVPTCL